MNPWPGRGMIAPRELGSYANLSAKVVRRMIDSGQIQATRLGRQWRIPRAEAFRVCGIVDPEGQSPAPITLRPRPRLEPKLEAVVQRLLAR